MLAQTLDGQPISAGIGSRQQRAFDTFAQSIDLGATGPGDGLDGEPLQSDVEQALEPYDPFTDAPYNPGQDAYDPISDSPYDDVVATPGLGSNQQQVEQSYVQDLNLGSTGPGPTTTPGLGSAQQLTDQTLVQDLNLGSTGPGPTTTPGLGSAQQRTEAKAIEDQDLGSTGPGPTTTPGLGSAQQRTEQEFAEDQDLGSTGPDYTDDLPTARHRYMALLQYADELDQELYQRQMLNTSAPGASAGVTIRERVPPERVAAMSGVDLNRLNAEIEARLLQHRSFFMDPDQTDAPTELSENVLKRDAPDESEVDDGARKRAKALTAADRATERARIRRAVTQRVQAKADQFPISVKPTIGKTRRGDRKAFFRRAMGDAVDATPGLGSARQQAQADFVASQDLGSTGKLPRERTSARANPYIANTSSGRAARREFFRQAAEHYQARADRADATPGLGSARQQAQADFVSSVNVGATGPLSTLQHKRDRFPISVKPAVGKTRRNDRKGFFRLALKDSADATPGLGSARQQAQADFVSSVNVGATGPQQLQRKERGELGVQPVVVKPKPSSRRPRLPPRRRNDEYRRMPVDLPPYVARPPNGFVVTEVPSADTDDADSQIRRLVDMDPGEDPGDPGDLGEDTGEDGEDPYDPFTDAPYNEEPTEREPLAGLPVRPPPVDDGEEPYDPVTDAPYDEDGDGYVTADDQLDDSEVNRTFDSLMDYYYDTTEPTDSNELPDGEQGLVDDVAEMAEDDEQAVDSGATNDGVGGPHVATDVDVAGNPIVQAIGAASIPTNRAPGGSRTQFGIQSYGVVRAAAPGPMNTEIRQGLIEQRKLAQASYVNTALAPVEDYAYAYQAPMPGYTPYYYGVYV